MEPYFNAWMLAGGAAGLTLVASTWGHLKNLYAQISGRVVVRITVSGFQADALLMYLQHHMTPSRFGPRAYVGWKLFVRPRARVQLVTMEVPPPTGRLYWRSWRPIWVAKSKEQLGDLEEGLQAQDYDYQTIRVTFARGMMDPDRLMLQATDYFNDQVRDYESTGGRRHSIRFVHGTAGNSATVTLKPRTGTAGPTSQSDIKACLKNRPLGWNFGDFGTGVADPGSAVDRLCLDDETETLVEEATRWRETESWHRERGLPWRRGYLLHGRPGTGKTALARAIAEDLDLPVFVYDLATLKNDELIKAWNQMLAEVPCLALIEDVDAVFEGRQNVAVTTGPSLTFDCLLNCLDGVQRADGLMVMVTTNHLHRIDPALGGVPVEDAGGPIGTRPGRIDRVVEMNELTDAGRAKMATRILGDRPDWIAKMIAAGGDDTPAQFQERCGRVALRLHYDPLDRDPFGDPLEPPPGDRSRDPPENPSRVEDRRSTDAPLVTHP